MNLTKQIKYQVTPGLFHLMNKKRADKLFASHYHNRDWDYGWQIIKIKHTIFGLIKTAITNNYTKCYITSKRLIEHTKCSEWMIHYVRTQELQKYGVKFINIWNGKKEEDKATSISFVQITKQLMDWILQKKWSELFKKNLVLRERVMELRPVQKAQKWIKSTDPPDEAKVSEVELVDPFPDLER